MALTLGEIARLVGGELEGDPALGVTGASSLEQARPGEISFLTGPKYIPQLAKTRASAVIVPRDLSLEWRPVIRSDNPYLAFVQLFRLLHPEPGHPPGIHGTAIIGEDAQIDPSATISPYCVVGAGAEIGAGTVLFPHVYVGNQSRVGTNCRLYPGVVIREGVQIGDRVILHPGVVIGADGFGYLFDGRSHQKIPQAGGVIIEDDVEIGANSAVDRATFGHTVIRRGTKIDNLVQVGHNVTVGEHSILVGQVGISGSCRIGSGVVLAGQVGVADHVTIGDGARVGGQSGVPGDLDGGADYMGSPAIPAMRFKRVAVAMQRLPELIKELRSLARRLEKVEARAGMTPSEPEQS